MNVVVGTDMSLQANHR